MPVPTVRIPELPPKSVDVDLSMEDRLPFWVSIQNKTRYVKLQDLYSFLLTGGGTTVHAPVEWGAQPIYIVPEDVAPGTTIASIPSLAGLDFTLQRGGIPMIALLADLSNADIADFEILDAGGFQLLQDDDELHPEERFLITLFSLIGGAGPTDPVTASSFIRGKKNVTTNITIDVGSDLNKTIQLRSLADQITITLPSVADVPENSFLIVESNINTSKENKIQTSGGQNIYFGNTSKTAIYIRPGEIFWLYRDSDGWFAISDFYKNYDQIGKPFATYKTGLNEIVCNGQTLNRVDYPRLFEWVQTIGSSYVSNAVRNLSVVYRQGNTYTTSAPVSGFYQTIPNPNRGCFGDGDGSTTFQLPDLMNVALRGVKTESGSDTERYLNKPGGFQLNANKSIWSGSVTKPVVMKVDGTFTETSTDNDPGLNQPNLRAPVIIDQSAFGIESVMDNVGMLWVIKC